VAEIAKFTPEQVLSYENSLKYYRDLKNSLDTARDEGKIEGKIEIAKKMILNGMDISLIIEMTGLTEQEIEKLNKDM
jgi:predicted transposase/invertase (TIGR01784 family)